MCNQKQWAWLIPVTFNIQLGYDSGLVIMRHFIDLADKIYFGFCSLATEPCWLSGEGFSVFLRMGDDRKHRGLILGLLDERESTFNITQRLNVASLAKKKKKRAKYSSAGHNIYGDYLLTVETL